MKMKDLNDMPAEHAALIVRMHHRMMKWREANSKKTVQIFWRNTGKTTIAAPIRTALTMGLVHTNECGYDMIATMCEPETLEPLSTTVRMAIELNS